MLPAARSNRSSPGVWGNDPLPPAAAGLASAFMAILPLILASPKSQSKSGGGTAAASTLIGEAASGGSYEGSAHVVDSYDDVHRITPGAVLVVGAGSSSFTMMAPLASAVVERSAFQSRDQVLRELQADSVLRSSGAPARSGYRGLVLHRPGISPAQFGQRPPLETAFLRTRYPARSTRIVRHPGQRVFSKSPTCPGRFPA